MRRGDTQTEPRGAHRNRREEYGRYEDPLLAQAPCQKRGGSLVIENHRDHRGFGITGIVTKCAQTVAQKRRVQLDTLHALRFVLEDCERGTYGRDGGRGERGGENERCSGVLQVYCKLLRHGDETTVRRYRLGKRTAPDIHFVGRDSKMLVSTAAMTAQHSRGVRLVDHQITAEFLFDRDEVRQF